MGSEDFFHFSFSYRKQLIKKISGRLVAGLDWSVTKCASRRALLFNSSNLMDAPPVKSLQTVEIQRLVYITVDIPKFSKIPNVQANF